MIQGYAYPAWERWAVPDFKRSTCTVVETWPETDLHFSSDCTKVPILVEVGIR
jgi:hypothetical protein